MTSLRQRNATNVVEKSNEPSVNLKAQTGETWGRDRGNATLLFLFFFLKKVHLDVYILINSNLNYHRYIVSYRFIIFPYSNLLSAISGVFLGCLHSLSMFYN
jgi:hypothetical protein